MNEITFFLIIGFGVLSIIVLFSLLVHVFETKTSFFQWLKDDDSHLNGQHPNSPVCAKQLEGEE